MWPMCDCWRLQHDPPAGGLQPNRLRQFPDGLGYMAILTDPNSWIPSATTISAQLHAGRGASLNATPPHPCHAPHLPKQPDDRPHHDVFAHRNWARCSKNKRRYPSFFVSASGRRAMGQIPRGYLQLRRPSRSIVSPNCHGSPGAGCAEGLGDGADSSSAWAPPAEE